MALSSISFTTAVVAVGYQTTTRVQRLCVNVIVRQRAFLLLMMVTITSMAGQRGHANNKERNHNNWQSHIKGLSERSKVCKSDQEKKPSAKVGNWLPFNMICFKWGNPRTPSRPLIASAEILWRPAPFKSKRVRPFNSLKASAGIVMKELVPKYNSAKFGMERKHSEAAYADDFADSVAAFGVFVLGCCVHRQHDMLQMTTLTSVTATNVAVTGLRSAQLLWLLRLLLPLSFRPLVLLIFLTLPSLATLAAFATQIAVSLIKLRRFVFGNLKFQLLQNYSSYKLNL
uniref:Uncharacterized protein n=1 Tax=Glossina pallidipes TaxID=7398 RepID=A0A1B0AI98_GLOPL